MKTQYASKTHFSNLPYTTYFLKTLKKWGNGRLFYQKECYLRANFLNFYLLKFDQLIAELRC